MPPSQDFEDYVSGHGDSLRRFAYLLCGDAHGAEDLVQTALLKMLPRWRDVTSTGSPDAYVRTVIVNSQRSLWRRSWLREQPTADLPELGHEGGAARVDDADLLRRALMALPKGQRAAVVLRFYEDRTEQETASILGCSVGTVKSQTHRALTALRLSLSREVTSGDQH